VTHYAFTVSINMVQLSIHRECWKPDCKEKSIFIFNFMDHQFPTCIEHTDEFFKVLKETYRIFLAMKGSDAK